LRYAAAREVDGALFSVGDTHAAQGDGEVCGTAIESPIDVALEFELVKGARLRSPRYVTPGPSRTIDKKGYEVASSSVLARPDSAPHCGFRAITSPLSRLR
jgi:acetamidase/formamidase